MAAQTYIVGPGIEIVDTGTNDPREADGTPILGELDKLRVIVNGTNREVVLQARNEDETGDLIPLRVEGPFIPPRYATGDLPTYTAAEDGALAFDTTTDDLKVWTGAAWVVVGTQS